MVTINKPCRNIMKETALRYMQMNLLTDVDFGASGCDATVVSSDSDAMMKVWKDKCG